MDRFQFEKYIEEAVMAVPADIRQKIVNVGFVIEDDARQANRQEREIKSRGILLGLYQGVPLTRRGAGYSAVLPDKITIFQRAIEQLAGPQDEDVRRLISEVVHHEIGHYFGMDERRVRHWEQQRRKKPGS